MQGHRLERLRRPLQDQLVGMGEALLGGEHGARVDDDGAEAECLGEVHQVNGDVHGANDDQLGWRAQHLEKELDRRAIDADGDRAGLGVFGAGGNERLLLECLAAEAAFGPAVRPDQHFVAEPLLADHRDHGRRLFGREHLLEGAPETHRSSCSSRSISTSSSPPQLSPTAQACSSVMP